MCNILIQIYKNKLSTHNNHLSKIQNETIMVVGVIEKSDP